MAPTYRNTLTQGILLHGKSYSYSIEKVLGQGSFGITYLASVKMQGALGSIDAKIKVAVKEFFMKEINGREGTTVTSGSKGGLFADYRKKFVREATNLSKLQHPNIIKVLECFEANNTVYYTMEYLDGGSLDELISKKHGLSEAETVKYTMQIGNALSYMHEHKVLHLDLKPGNIMLSNGNAVLIDFGLSKQYDAGGNPESSTTVGAGTPGYAPIEQSSYRDGKGFPVTMDVYALGATMYKMLTGKRLPNASEVLNDGLPDKPASVSSEGWAAVIAAMEPMHKNRPQTVQEWKAILIDNNETAVAIVDVEIAKNKESRSDSNDNNGSEEYHKGISAYEARDYQNAIKWFKIASCLNDGEACFMLFRMYDEGQGVAKNEDKAKGYLTKAAENHHPKALLKLGTYYEDAKYFDLAFEYFQHRVSDGDVEANLELAELYLYKKRRNDAVNCAKQLLDYLLNQSGKEDTESLYRLSSLYDMLDNEDSADKYLLAAAQKGHVESANIIGRRLLMSNEASKIEEGITWLSFAAEKGCYDAIDELISLYTINLLELNVDKDYNEALKWHEVGASFGFIDCVYNIGEWLWDGLRVEKDKNKGFGYIKKAAEAGLQKAQKDLAHIFLENEDFADFEEAYKWYNKCAEHGDASCINKLGLMNVLAFGVPQNFSKARKLFEKAAEKENNVDDGEAEYNLGILYEYGYGVAINYSEAVKWYLRSCEHAHDNSHARKKLISLQERGLYDGDIPHDSFIYPCGGLPHIPAGYFGDYIDTKAECELEEHRLKIDTPKYVCSYYGGSFRKRFNKEPIKQSLKNETKDNPSQSKKWKWLIVGTVAAVLVAAGGIIFSSVYPSAGSFNVSALSDSVIQIKADDITYNMVKVQGGTFTMGATAEMEEPNDDEKPIHQVTLSSYYIGETEVTQALWKAVMGSNPSSFKGDNLPVEQVSWDDCQEFIRKLNEMTKRKFRLPTEAEWEFAARGGNKSYHTQYSGSSDIDEVAWYFDNSGSKTHPVKEKKANELGIYDMTGNVWEWCQDWYGSYSSGAETNPTGATSGAYRVYRGGSWNSNARCCRSSYRYFNAPDFRNYNLGFRLVLSE